jgi:hypothetical protein
VCRSFFFTCVCVPILLSPCGCVQQPVFAVVLLVATIQHRIMLES